MAIWEQIAVSAANMAQTAIFFVLMVVDMVDTS